MTRRLGLAAGLALAVGLFAGPTLAAGAAGAKSAPPPEPAGYRMDDYRSPTPATLAGARVIDTEAAVELWRDRSAVFIDTMPRDEKPANLPPGTIWRDRPREHLPGSAWLANVGYGALSPVMSAYFRDALAALSGGDMDKRLLFYCKAACWMSWNAAKHAMELGYRDVVWYPEGTDGWDAAGLPLELAKPYEIPAPPTR